MGLDRVGLVRVPLAAVLEHYRPGSGDWSWDEEGIDLDSRVCVCCNQPGHYQAQIEDYLRGLGRVEQGICLGNDGRVWDGHHRIIAARRLHFADIPLETDSYRPSWWPTASTVSL